MWIRRRLYVGATISKTEFTKKASITLHITQAKAGVDRSAQDWRMCCSFFENSPEASIAQAQETLKGQWAKAHNDMQTYMATTLRKAFEKVRKTSQATAPPHVLAPLPSSDTGAEDTLSMASA